MVPNLNISPQKTKIRGAWTRKANQKEYLGTTHHAVFPRKMEMASSVLSNLAFFPRKGEGIWRAFILTWHFSRGIGGWGKERSCDNLAFSLGRGGGGVATNPPAFSRPKRGKCGKVPHRFPLRNGKRLNNLNIQGTLLGAVADGDRVRFGCLCRRGFNTRKGT